MLRRTPTIILKSPVYPAFISVKAKEKLICTQHCTKLFSIWYTAALFTPFPASARADHALKIPLIPVVAGLAAVAAPAIVTAPILAVLGFGTAGPIAGQCHLHTKSIYAVVVGDQMLI